MADNRVPADSSRGDTLHLCRMKGLLGLQQKLGVGLPAVLRADTGASPEAKVGTKDTHCHSQAQIPERRPGQELGSQEWKGRAKMQRPAISQKRDRTKLVLMSSIRNGCAAWHSREPAPSLKGASGLGFRGGPSHGTAPHQGAFVFLRILVSYRKELHQHGHQTQDGETLSRCLMGKSLDSQRTKNTLALMGLARA